MTDSTSEVPPATTDNDEPTPFDPPDDHDHDDGSGISCSMCGRDPDEDNGVIVGVPLGGDSPTCNLCIEEYATESTFLPQSEAEPIAYKLLEKTVGEAADFLVARRGDDAPAKETVKGYYKRGMRTARPALETYFAVEPFIYPDDHEIAEYDPDSDKTCGECGNENDFEGGIVVNTPPDGEGGFDTALCSVCLEKYFTEETELPERQAQIVAYRLLGLSHTQVQTALDGFLGGEGPTLGAVKTHYNRAIEKGKIGAATYALLAPLHEQRRAGVQPAF